MKPINKLKTIPERSAMWLRNGLKSTAVEIKNLRQALSYCMPILAMAIGLSACEPHIPIQKLDDMDKSVLRAADGIQIVSLDEAKQMQIVGAVAGHSCKHLLWDPAATEDAAMRQMKIDAAQSGAKAITAARCQAKPTSLGTNCWESVSCAGTALR